MQSTPQLSQEKLALRGPGEAPLASAVASAEETSLEDLAVVWYIFERRSREAELVVVVGLGVPLTVVASFGLGLVPGCKDCKPRGVSSTTRK